MASLHARCRTALALHDVRRLATDLGARHFRRQVAAVVDNVSNHETHLTPGHQPDTLRRVQTKLPIRWQNAPASAILPLHGGRVPELTRGRKETHWILFVFPQIDGLGRSPTAKQYAIKSRDEAVAYLATPLLGARLIECTKLVLAVPKKSAHEIFGSPDDMKFRSSMTLFDAFDGSSLYRQALDRFYGGESDLATLAILKEWA
jgi:uncharacterized protein (DUF1810 family)